MTDDDAGGYGSMPISAENVQIFEFGRQNTVAGRVSLCPVYCLAVKLGFIMLILRHARLSVWIF